MTKRKNIIDNRLIYEIFIKYEFISALEFLFRHSTRGEPAELIIDLLNESLYWKEDREFLKSLFERFKLTDSKTQIEIAALVKGIDFEVHFFDIDDLKKQFEHRVFAEDLKEAKNFLTTLKGKDKVDGYLPLKIQTKSHTFMFKSKIISDLIADTLKNLTEESINEEILKSIDLDEVKNLNYKVQMRAANLDSKVNTNLRRKVAKIIFDYVDHKQLFNKKDNNSLLYNEITLLFVGEILVFFGFLQSKKERSLSSDTYEDKRYYESYQRYLVKNVRSILKYTPRQRNKL